METTAQIFLSYAREDKEKVEKLYQKLSDARFKPWMDIKDILPGESWKPCIQKAIRRSDFFLACLSANSVSKRGFLQKELKDALDIWREKLDSDIYLIPVRLEDCEVPESLHEFQWVNLFEADGWTRLVKAIRAGIERRTEVPSDREIVYPKEGPERAPWESAEALKKVAVEEAIPIWRGVPPPAVTPVAVAVPERVRPRAGLPGWVWVLVGGVLLCLAGAAICGVLKVIQPSPVGTATPPRIAEMAGGPTPTAGPTVVAQVTTPAATSAAMPQPTATPTGMPLLPTLTPSLAPYGGRIAFRSNRDNDWEIYAMNADGSGLTNLTKHRAHDYAPSWSPDGTRIAFESERDGFGLEIYVVNADGSGMTRLTNNPGSDRAPSWSPDSTHIAFESERGDSAEILELAPEIYVVNADGSEQTNLTNNSGWDKLPSWSPDGARIAFISHRGDSYDIYAMNADGSGVTRLTNRLGVECAPSWSPDGTRIAFQSRVYTRVGGDEIYVMNADGSGVTRLTNESIADCALSWSPDGTRIVFRSERDGNDEIYVMNADGSGQMNLTNHPADDRNPSWSPDGTHIAFQSDRDGNDEIYVMNADGSEVTRLTNHPAYDGDPAWGP